MGHPGKKFLAMWIDETFPLTPLEARTILLETYAFMRAVQQKDAAYAKYRADVVAIYDKLKHWSEGA